MQEQTQFLIATLDAMQENELREPSLLPSWSRGHVLAHIDGNARGIARLVRWALDGNRRDMYISPEARDGDIEIHARRSLKGHRDAVAESANELADVYALLDTEHLGVEVTLRNGRVVKVGSLLKMRLQEVAIHHLDLNLAGFFAPAQWPLAMVQQLLPEVAADFAARSDLRIGWVEALGGVRYQIEVASETGVTGVTGVSGPAPDLLAWLLGRSAGSGLLLTGVAELPTVPNWR